MALTDLEWDKLLGNLNRDLGLGSAFDQIRTSMSAATKMIININGLSRTDASKGLDGGQMWTLLHCRTTFELLMRGILAMYADPADLDLVDVEKARTDCIAGIDGYSDNDTALLAAASSPLPGDDAEAMAVLQARADAMASYMRKFGTACE